MIIRRTFFALWLIFAFLSAHSQKFDSLHALLPGTTGIERIDILYELSYKHIEFNNNIALKYGIEGYNLAISINDSLRIVRMGLVMASALRRLQIIDSSLVVYNSILKISERKNYKEELALVLNSMAIAFSFKAQYDKALECYFRSLRLRESEADKGSEITVLQNIAWVYYKLKDYEKALKIYLECYEFRKSDHYEDDGFHELILINIAHCYAYLGDFSKARLYVDKALQYCEMNCSPQRILESNFVNGVISFGERNFKKAEEYFLKSYSLAKTSNDIRFQLDNIDYLAQIYTAQYNISSAFHFLKEAENLIERNASFNLERIKIYSGFSQLFLKTRNFEKASHYQLKYSRLKDSIYNEEMTTNLMKAEAGYLERENTAKIAAQNQVIELKEEIIHHQKILSVVTALFALILVGFLVVLFRSYLQKKDFNSALEEKIDARTRELQLSRDELLKAFQERDLLLHRASHGVSETMKTIKGLCVTGMKEVSDPVARSYMSRIDFTSRQLANYMLPHFEGTVAVYKD